MSNFPIDPVNTGQQFPEGIELHKGQCEQCGRKGKVAKLRLELTVNVFMPNATDDGVEEIVPPAPMFKTVCAECLADFVMAPFTKTYARCNGRWQRLAGELQ
jgi:hypothetical protein